MIAKSSPTHQETYMLERGRLLEEVLRCVDISDIWGIGSRYAEMLHSFGIYNALDLRDAPEHWIKSTMSVVGQRIWYELYGVSCLILEQSVLAKKGICSSRSFPVNVTDLVSVFISTNRFEPQDKPLYAKTDRHKPEQS